MADWNKPVVTDTYTSYTSYLKDRDLDVAVGLDPAVVTVTNPQTNMIRWNSSANRWEKYNGSSWVPLSSSYAISISGSAGSVSWANVTGKPSTLSGYGITDGQPLDADLTAIAALSTTGVIARTGAGTAATRTLVAPSAGLSISNADGVSGNPTFALANDISALEGLSGTGIAVRTGTDAWAQRSIVAGSGRVVVSNGNGVAGNPTIDVDENSFATAILKTLVDAKGDLIVGTADNVVTRKPVGANNAVLVADSSQSDGMKWTTTLAGVTVTNPDNTVQTLTFGSTTNWDMNLGHIAVLTLTGNTTMAAPTNLKNGVYILHVIQDGTGGRTITWNSVFKWPAGSAPPLTSSANARDVFSFVCDGTNLYGSILPDVR